MTSLKFFALPVFIISIFIYGVFWIWAMLHAGTTPHSKRSQRILWVGSMLINPSTAVWYWYIWKRWAFWLLFTPILSFFIALPWVVRSVLSKAEATALTDILFSIGTPRFVIFLAIITFFPLILRLASLLHLGRNKALNAMDRNDWVVAIALPLFGFGAAFAYSTKHQRRWAIASMAYWVALSVSAGYVWPNVSLALQSRGEQRREEFKMRPAPPLPRILR